MRPINCGVVKIKRALISVYDKTDITLFAKGLSDMGFEIISTGGTFDILSDAGVGGLIKVEDITGVAEMMDGRVKTLHPGIHGGILADRDIAMHMDQLAAAGAVPIDIVVCNLYPFELTINRPDVTMSLAIENIDVGGPCMIRAAAKNHQYVTVVTDAADYGGILDEIRDNGGVSAGRRRELAAKAFAMTARYDACIANHLNNHNFPETLNLSLRRQAMFSYGENPHQRAAFYGEPFVRQIHGGALSFNNINDANGAVMLLLEFSNETQRAAAVACKHGNPCGVGAAPTLAEAFAKAKAADPVSIYGGIVAFNREVDAETAALMKGILIDVVIAPAYSPDAIGILAKKKGTRLLELVNTPPGLDYKRVLGGVIVQESDGALFPEGTSIETLSAVTKRGPSAAERADMLFAWTVVKHVKSNAIVIAKDGQTLGIGCGQVNRFWATNQAIEHAEQIFGADALRGAALASDAFFPFDDCVGAAARAGVGAIIQPGGSIRDADSVNACDRHGIAMILTGMRHFRH